MRGEEDGGAAKVVRRSHPSQGHGDADLALLLAERQALVFGEQRVDVIPHRGVDNAGRDPVDVDAVLDQVEPGGLSQADDRRLGRAIDGDQRFAAPACLRRHIDDLPAATLLHHLRRRRLKRKEQTLRIDGEHFVEARLGNFQDRPHVEHPCIVEQNVDAPELGDRRRNQRRNGFRNRGRQVLPRARWRRVPRRASQPSRSRCPL